MLKCRRTGCGCTVLRYSGVFSLLRCDGKANRKEPERKKERTLKHAELKTESQQTPAEFLRKPKALTIPSS